MPEERKTKKQEQVKKKQEKESKTEKEKPKSEPKEKHKEKPQERKHGREKILAENLFRILGTDIPANMTIYSGLTKIKGVSWTFSNAICNSLKIDKNKKMTELSEQDLKKIIDFIKNPDPSLPPWLFNRRKDPETGEDKHLVTTDLDLRKGFDIRAMKKMKSYKGIRHIMGQPVRGQRTRGHFRQGKAIGVQRTKVSSRKGGGKKG